jgi:hypothetical protein
MAGGLGNHYGQQILDYLLGGNLLGVGGGTGPAIWSVALFSVAPSDSGGGTEITGGGYARFPLINVSANLPASTVAGGVATKLTGTPISWGPATGAPWPQAVAVGLFDNATGGNLGWYGPLGTPVTVGVGQSLTVAAGSGVFTEG